MVLSKCIGILLLAIGRKHHPPLILKFVLLSLPHLLLPLQTKVGVDMVLLSRIKILDVHQQYIRTVLFLSLKNLSEIDGPGNRKSVAVVYLHSVDVPVVAYPKHILGEGFIGEETHTLVPPVLAGPACSQHQSVPGKLVKNGFEHVQTRISPETAVEVHQLVAHDVDYCRVFLKTGFS